MPIGKALIAVLALAALPAAAQEWKQLRRDSNAMLSVDMQSIKRKGAEAQVDYMVDFRAGQGGGPGEAPIRSIIVRAQLDCKNRTIALLHTDAYAQYGGKGIIIAKTSPATGAKQQPLEGGSSDEEVWRHVCEGKRAPFK